MYIMRNTKCKDFGVKKIALIFLYSKNVEIDNCRCRKMFLKHFSAFEFCEESST